VGELTSHGYSLLRLFVHHAGKVLTHRQILREVCGGLNSVQEQTPRYSPRVYMAHSARGVESWTRKSPKTLFDRSGIWVSLGGSCRRSDRGPMKDSPSSFRRSTKQDYSAATLLECVNAARSQFLHGPRLGIRADRVRQQLHRWPGGIGRAAGATTVVLATDESNRAGPRNTGAAAARRQWLAHSLARGLAPEARNCSPRSR
jgi:hypothetical protein